jgi:hypothetical protein
MMPWKGWEVEFGVFLELMGFVEFVELFEGRLKAKGERLKADCVEYLKARRPESLKVKDREILIFI